MDSRTNARQAITALDDGFGLHFSKYIVQPDGRLTPTTDGAGMPPDDAGIVLGYVRAYGAEDGVPGYASCDGMNTFAPMPLPDFLARFEADDPKEGDVWVYFV